MSTPVTMPTQEMPGRSPAPDGSKSFGDVAGYLAAVRAQLDDLRPDEIEELTGGLEADLADELAGTEGTPLALFGRPADYAAELRSSAGLAPRPARRPGLRRPADRQALALGLRETGERLLGLVRNRRWWPDLRDFVVTLRPVWWLLRGYVAYQWADHLLTDVNQLLPYSLVTWLVLAALLVASVELGRRGWAGRSRWGGGLIAAGNLVAVLVIAFALVDSQVAPGAALNRIIHETRYVEVPAAPASDQP